MNSNSKGFFVHPLAICETNAIGERSRVYAFSHILDGAVIGQDCNINDHVFVEGTAIIGDRVTIKSGVQIWNGIKVGNDVFIGPNVTFTNDHFPRSRKWLTEFPTTVIHDGASLGANSTILPGIEIGRNSMVGAGSVVTKNVPPNAVVFGNPAKIYRYISDEFTEQKSTPSFDSKDIVETSSSDLISTHDYARDLRGNLTAIDLENKLSFKPVRFFSVNHVPSSKVRGEHAHRECKQYLVALNGSLRVFLDDGKVRRTYLLDTSNFGLYIAPMTWASQYDFSKDCVLGVFASHAYDESDYIRDYATFLAEIENGL